MANMFKKLVDKLGVKLDLRDEFDKLQAEIIRLHKEFPLAATTRLELEADRARVDKQLKENGKAYNKEIKALNYKYKQLDKQLLIEGMKREIQMRKHANPDSFRIEV